MEHAVVQPHEPVVTLAAALVGSSQAPLLLLDKRLTVVGASRSFCGAFGIDPDTVDGLALAALGNGEWNVPQLRSLLDATFAGNAAVDAYELELKRAGEATACLLLNARLLDYDEARPLLILTVTDITAQRSNEKIRDGLVQEKHVLLQELQHRVANSLQIIASVLMQSARRVQSEETRLHLHDAHRRVMSVATLQRQLSESPDESVKLADYLQSLCTSIGASMIDDDHRIVLAVTADGSSAPAGISVSLGLIVTELVINALKHAFPGRNQHGTIAVTYASNGTGFALSVADNGVGIKAGEGQRKPGLGTGIVDALSKQLGATVETIDNSPGTRVSITRAP